MSALREAQSDIAAGSAAVGNGDGEQVPTAASGGRSVLSPAGQRELTIAPLTAYHEALYDRGGALAAQTVPLLNETLGRLITLDTALIGGGFVIAKGDTPPFWWGVGVPACLLVSLASALFGVVPTEGTVDRSTLSGLDAIPAFEAGVVKRKKWATRVAAGALVTGFAVGVTGLASSGPPAKPAPAATAP